MKVLEIQNPKYTDCTKKSIDCEILFEEIGEFIPYTASSTDPDTADIYAQCAEMIGAPDVDQNAVAEYEYNQAVQEIEAKRAVAYRVECDPLTLESIVKRSMGLDTEADELLQKAVLVRAEIQSRYPYPEKV